MPLQPYARAFASTVLRSPEPQGTYFVSCSSVSWFSTLAKIERSVHWFTRYCFYLSERFSLEPLKQYSVVNVRYSYDTILTLICFAPLLLPLPASNAREQQACMLRAWTNNEQSDFQNKICKLLPLFVKSMVSLLIVRLSALPCIHCGVRSSERGTPPKPQTRTRLSSLPLNGEGLLDSTDNKRHPNDGSAPRVLLPPKQQGHRRQKGHRHRGAPLQPRS